MDPQNPAIPTASAQPSQSPQQQVIEHIKEAKNLLVTVSTNPSVDQLAAAIGLTLALNKLGKHATAVFSGEVPSTIEFLQPEKTLEKNTDSLRDFIIALDKSKADKLRYKVEDAVVKIFITPYRTSLSEKDLEFSQGDFNVDLVLALGVREQGDIDQAISAHGRILHDAAVITVNNHDEGNLGSINWNDGQASSLCEMLTGVSEALQVGLLDGQMATAYLTGIVAETSRFSNEKTSPATMNIASRLMSAGANQQLVVTKLEENQQPPPPPDEPEAPAGEVGPPKPTPDGSGPPDELPQPQAPTSNGTLEIDHQESSPTDAIELDEEMPGQQIDRIHIDDQGTLTREQELEAEKARQAAEAATAAMDTAPNIGSKRIMEPPALGGQLTANTVEEALDPALDPLTLPPLGSQPPLLSHDAPAAVTVPAQPLAQPLTPFVTLPISSPTSQATPALTPLPEPAPAAQADDETLSEIEQSVHSPHAASTDPVAAAQNPTSDPLPVFNPQSVDLNPSTNGDLPLQPANSTLDPADFSGLPSVAFTDTSQPAADPNTPQDQSPMAPPPVPPPMMPLA